MGFLACSKKRKAKWLPLAKMAQPRCALFMRIGRPGFVKAAFFQSLMYPPCTGTFFHLRTPLGAAKESRKVQCAHISIKRAKAHYRLEAERTLCDCDSCKHYRSRIKSAYPEIASHLAKWGIAMEKPFEACPLEPDADGFLTYCVCQYIVFGTCPSAEPLQVGDVTLRLSAFHPSTGIEEAHFLLDVYPIKLQYEPAATPNAPD